MIANMLGMASLQSPRNRQKSSQNWCWDLRGVEWISVSFETAGISLSPSAEQVRLNMPL